jgi:PhzF family phenazine biosynthesis protein
VDGTWFVQGGEALEETLGGMIEPKVFFVDSFTSEPFRGNSAAVCLLENELEDAVMLRIAKEFGLSETAFVLNERIRFFSPKMEIPLCGHALLAVAKVHFHLTERQDLRLTTGRGVEIRVSRVDDRICVQLPWEDVKPGTILKAALIAMGIEQVLNVSIAADSPILVVELADANALQALRPDFEKLEVSCHSVNGIVVTAPGLNGFDYQLRYLWPWSGTNEDPVTGGVQRFLAPYWAQRLGKKELRAFQCSERGGEMDLEVPDDGVRILGQAVIVLEGRLLV